MGRLIDIDNVMALIDEEIRVATIQKNQDYKSKIEELKHIRMAIEYLPTAYSVEKVLAELEEAQDKLETDMWAIEDNNWYGQFCNGTSKGIDDAISIINQLAEEYNEKDCSQCSRRSWYQMGYADAEKEIKEKCNNGWIYCSNMLPGYDVTVLLSLKNKYSYIGYRTIIMEEEHFYIEGNGYVKPEEVIAWMPLPHLYEKVGVVNE